MWIKYQELSICNNLIINYLKFTKVVDNLDIISVNIFLIVKEKIKKS